MSRFVIVTMLEEGGEEFVHLPNGASASDYVTLCGLDGGVAGSEQCTREAPKGVKVNCPACRGIWQLCRDFRKTDFEGE